MNGDELALEMGRKLGQLEPVPGERSRQLVAVRPALRRLAEIEQPGVPGGNLNALVAVAGGPAGDGVQTVEGSGVPGELGEEDRRALDPLPERFPMARSF